MEFQTLKFGKSRVSKSNKWIHLQIENLLHNELWYKVRIIEYHDFYEWWNDINDLQYKLLHGS